MKKTKHPRFDDPSAFSKQWPLIREVKDNTMSTPLSNIMPTKIYEMGKCKIILHEADAQLGWFMSIRRADRYPSWDEIVWVRYNLIPDAALMMLKLPNLNAYINQEKTDYVNVFTMEQVGWALDPAPTCHGKNMTNNLTDINGLSAFFTCTICGRSIQVDFNTWNETSGNGYLAKGEPKP